jgi:hypothetical protein
MFREIFIRGNGAQLGRYGARFFLSAAAMTNALSFTVAQTTTAAHGSAA